MLDEIKGAEKFTYSVGLVIVLRIVFEDLGTLLVIECSHEVVHTSLEVFSPFFAIDEPGAILLVF